MTDTPSTSLPYNPALVAETKFERQGFFLPEFAVHHFLAGQSIIEGKTFTDCIIEGPGILMAVVGVEFDGCSMGSTSDARNLLMQPLGEKVVGVIPFSNTRFIRCKFNRVGFTGHPDFMASFEGLSRMSEGKAS